MTKKYTLPEQIYTYLPVHEKPVYINRLEQYGAYISEILNVPYMGHFNEQTPPPNQNILWIPNNLLSWSDAKRLHIQSQNQIWGCVAPALWEHKTIFRPLVPQPLNIHREYPQNFNNELLKHQLMLSGFSVFSQQDALKAFQIISKNSDVVRLKLPTADSGDGQYVVETEHDLLAHLRKLGEEYINQNGLVLEEQISEPIQVYSVGWDRIGGQTYFYIGKQYHDLSSMGRSYAGTTLYVVKGDINYLENVLRDQFEPQIKVLRLLKEALIQLQPMLCTRYNFDLIEKNGKLFVLEGRFSIGGASAALIVAIQQLMSLPDGSDAIGTYHLLDANVAKPLSNSAPLMFLEETTHNQNIIHLAYEGARQEFG